MSRLLLMGAHGRVHPRHARDMRKRGRAEKKAMVEATTSTPDLLSYIFLRWQAIVEACSPASRLVPRLDSLRLGFFDALALGAVIG